MIPSGGGGGNGRYEPASPTGPDPVTLLGAVRRRLAPGRSWIGRAAARLGIQRDGRAPLPDDGFQARIRPLEPPDVVGTAETIQCAVEVTNLSRRTWPASGTSPVGVSYHWLCADGQVLVYEGERTYLSRPLPPGGRLTLPCRVQTPGTRGTFVLELDLVQEHVAWFKDRGSSAARVNCVVRPKRPADFGEYEDVWRRADLSKDYWSAVGASSKEEFTLLGQWKLDMLKRIGLTPRSRVLDVGCGTGSLTAALQDFLDDAGCYYGTEIHAIPVEFCRSRFHRANFVFLKSGMTKIPIDDARFDFVTFFSVFTHTYPDETAALLEEAWRCLAEGGVILADLFLSPAVEEFAGNRALVEVNAQAFLRRAEAGGLRVETIEEYPWEVDDHELRRAFFKLTRLPAEAPR